MNRVGIAIVGVFAMLAVTYNVSCFQVGEWQQAIVLQFGRPIRTIVEPGLQFKKPFLQKVVYFEKRLLEYDAAPRELITRDKQQLVVDNFSRWRIVDPLKFYQTVLTIAGAQSRLDDIIYSNLREALGKKTVGDVVSGDREVLMGEVTRNSNTRAAEYGIEVVDVRIKRTDLPEKNEQNIFSRMRTERERQAKTFRAQGEEESRKIGSQARKEREVILAEARKKAEITRGQAEADSTRIYAEAYNLDTDFYLFMRTLEAYRTTLSGRTTLLLDPSSEFLKLLTSSK